MSEPFTEPADIEGELIAEEDAGPAERADRVRALPRRFEPGENLPAITGEVKTAAIAVAGGALAGAATVAAVRVVSGAGSRRKPSRRARRRDRANIVASRSFLIDVHLLGR